MWSMLTITLDVGYKWLTLPYHITTSTCIFYAYRLAQHCVATSSDDSYYTILLLNANEIVIVCVYIYIMFGKCACIHHH